MSNPQPLHHQSGSTTWPAALPESITRPGPEGWACFPQATATFFVPPQPTMALQGEVTALVAQEPSCNMPAEVTLSPEEIKVWFGDWPTILRGRSFRPVQYEVQEVDAPDAETMRGSLSLAPCNQVLEGRYARHASSGEVVEEGMWFIRLGPRDDTGYGDPGGTLPGRMGRWHREQAATAPSPD